MKRITVPLLLFALFISMPLLASDALTGKTVRDFIDSLKELEQLGNKYESDRTTTSDGNQSIDQTMQMIQSPFSTAASEMIASKFYNEYLGVIKRHGFVSAEQWSQVGNRIYYAIAAVQMEKEMPGNMDQQIAQAQEQMKASGMSAEQQKMMIDMMAASRQAMQQFENVPQADREVVKPYIAEFEQLGDQ